MTRSELLKRIRAMQFWRRDTRAYYWDIFGAPETEPTRSQAAVLQDLRRFCYADRRTSVRDGDNRVDPIATALLEGRREAYLHIVGYLGLSELKLQRIEQMELQQRGVIERRVDEDDSYAA